MPKRVPYEEMKINLPCSLVFESQVVLVREIAAEKSVESKCSQSSVIQEAMNDYITKHRESERG